MLFLRCQRLYPISINHKPWSLKLISGSLPLVPRSVCMSTCLPNMTSSINILWAVQAQLVPFSDVPLNNLSWDPVVIFIPHCDLLTSTYKQHVAYQCYLLCTFKLTIICHWDYRKSPNCSIFLFYSFLFILPSGLSFYLKICAYGIRIQTCFENFIVPTSPQNGSLK